MRRMPTGRAAHTPTGKPIHALKTGKPCFPCRNQVVPRITPSSLSREFLPCVCPYTGGGLVLRRRCGCARLFTFVAGAGGLARYPLATAGARGAAGYRGTADVAAGSFHSTPAAVVAAIKQELKRVLLSWPVVPAGLWFTGVGTSIIGIAILLLPLTFLRCLLVPGLVLD